MTLLLMAGALHRAKLRKSPATRQNGAKGLDGHVFGRSASGLYLLIRTPSPPRNSIPACSSACLIAARVTPRGFLRPEHSLPPAPLAAPWVSSMSAQGLSHCELIRTSAIYSPAPRHRRHHTARGLPPPAGLLDPASAAALRQRSGAFCSDPVQEYLAPIRLLTPRRPEFRSRLYPPPTEGGSRLGFAFAVARPFVCECRTIPAIPALRTIPGLPGSLTLFPTVSPANTLVRRSGTQSPSPP